MSHRITIDMFKSEYDEIRSVLAKNGRSDLIKVLTRRRDDDYVPPPRKSGKTKGGKTKEYFEYYEDYDSSESEGEDESYTADDVVVDKDGFFFAERRLNQVISFGIFILEIFKPVHISYNNNNNFSQVLHPYCPCIFGHEFLASCYNVPSHVHDSSF